MEQTNFVERRKNPRFDRSDIPSLKSIHLVAETEIKLINISRGGALIEAQRRMMPGSPISLKISYAKKVYHLAGKVLRSNIREIDKMVTYRVAIVFNEEFAILPSD